MPEPKNLMQSQWSVNRSYRTGSDEEPLQCYLEGLVNSNNFDLLLGYFSSSAINVLSIGFANFLHSNGTMRMIINNVLSQEDKDAISKGQEGSIKNNLIDITDIKKLKSILDEYGKHFFECLAWLIANEKIQIRIIKPKNEKGIAHYKSGIFSDGENQVRFKASCNFTSYGLLENLEELDIHLSWENNPSNRNIINSQQEYFNTIFSGNADFVDYLEVNDILIAIKDEFGNKSLHELIVQEEELIAQKNQIIDNKHLKKLFAKLTEKFEKITKEPRFPYPSGPREYQIEAYKKWVDNKYQGIFAMATGTGKTITSLNCALEEFKINPSSVYHILVLVPSIILVEQWEKEASSFNFKSIYKISSKNDWQNTVTTMLSTARRIPLSFVIISTYQSFVKDTFQSLIKQFPFDTIFISDEAHNLASPLVKSKLSNIIFSKRIGLSATPKRIYDFDGTSVMETFFNDREPYSFSFSMEKAIREGVLCEYYYFPHIIKLTEVELDEYIEITEKLSRMHFSLEDLDGESPAKMLLLKRKRIIHKAENKLGETIKILKNLFEEKGNLKYTFVYVPEGVSIETKAENIDYSQEEVNLINIYTREIAKIDDRIKVNQFISGQKDRDEILKQFQNGEIDIIASMKCLDEGVDIPRAEVAVFCSSTGNPRQFIQRRGRILRKHPNKEYAIIHDLVVIPDYENNIEGNLHYALEQKLVKKELERVMYFASLSRNPFFSETVFKQVCNFYNLNIYKIQEELITI